LIVCGELFLTLFQLHIETGNFYLQLKYRGNLLVQPGIRYIQELHQPNFRELVVVLALALVGSFGATNEHPHIVSSSARFFSFFTTGGTPRSVRPVHYILSVHNKIIKSVCSRCI
jgi:hypothetical protein